MFVSIYYKPSLFNAHTMILIVHIFMNVNKLCLNQKGKLSDTDQTQKGRQSDTDQHKKVNSLILINTKQVNSLTRIKQKR